MKKITFLFLSLILSLVAISQTILKNSVTGFSNLNNYKITRVELNDTATILSFTAYGTPGSQLGIPKDSYIQPLEKKKLYVKSTQGIPFNQPIAMPSSGEASFKVIFPKIDKSLNVIDFCLNIGDGLFIYDIQLKKETNKPTLPQELVANWFNAKTGDWELSFTNKSVIYKSKVWSYDKIELKKGKGTVRIKNGEQTVDLFVKGNRDGSCLIGLSRESFTLYQKDHTKLAKKIQDTDKPFELPIFKIDSATYSGYIKDYNTRIGTKTLNITVHDILDGEPKDFFAKVSTTGFFSIKLPLFYPHEVYVSSLLYNGSVFLEPGKDLFQLIDYKRKPLFMGDGAKINTDLTTFQDGFLSYNQEKVRNSILTTTSADYKTYCQSSFKRDLDRLDSIYKTNSIGAKAYQVRKLDLEYTYMYFTMDYESNYEMAYKEKNNIPRNQNTLNIKSDSLSASYYDFITNENANNPLGILCFGYLPFIQRLIGYNIENLDSVQIGVPILEIVSELQKRNYEFTESEKIFIEQEKAVNLLAELKEQKEYEENYSKRIREFNAKYEDKLQPLYQESKVPVTYSIIKAYLISKGVILTESEKQTIKASETYLKLESTIKISDISKKMFTTNTYNEFFIKHKDVRDELVNQKEKESQFAYYKKMLGIQPGLATDIILSQDVCKSMAAELKPISDTKLRKIQDQLTTPFIAYYIALFNQQTKNASEANKKILESNGNNVSQTIADSVLGSILKKYKGKVVYVDFWATWCGPCRFGIDLIEPLKEKMTDKDVVFVYITNHTSPLDTWLKLTPTIKGEHFRVSEDQWNFLKNKYKITGIPHTMLVDKNGVVRNSEVIDRDNGTLKAEFEKLLIE